MSPGDDVPPPGSNVRVRAKTRSEGEAGVEQREVHGHQRWLEEEGAGFKDTTKEIEDNEEGDSG